MTYSLAIDTSGPFCSVALASADTSLCLDRSTAISRGHAEILLSEIDALFQLASAQAGQPIGYGDLTRVAVVTGPGSFTGLRVGLSVARGIALAQMIPCIGVSGLDLLAFEALTTTSALAVTAVLPGRGGQIFYGSYEGPSGKKCQALSDMHPLGEPGNDNPAVLYSGREEIFIAGPAEELVCQSALNELKVTRAQLEKVSARVLAQVSFAVDPADYPPEPLYLRGADAVKAKAFFPLSPDAIQ